MRKLVLLRGVPGSGKTTWVKKHGMEKYALSPDKLFEMTTSVSMSPSGEEGVDHSRLYGLTMELYEKILEQRMRDGSFIVVDALNIKSSDFDKYIPLAMKYAYEIVCVDFSEVPLEWCVKRKPALMARQIRQSYDRMMAQKLPNINVVSCTDPFLDEILMKKTDLSRYKKIHHIGDIHGCSAALSRCLCNMQKDEFYIFCGDYINKGPDSAGVLKFLSSIADFPNVVLLEGNHEEVLKKWIEGERAENDEFYSTTIQQLEGTISRKTAKKIKNRLKECFWYTAGEKNVFICHGGTPSLSRNPVFIPARDLINGCGLYADARACDDSFAITEPDNILVHGHRNPGGSDFKVNENCYCLEGDVEGHGALRELILDTETGEFSCLEFPENI